MSKIRHEPLLVAGVIGSVAPGNGSTYGAGGGGAGVGTNRGGANGYQGLIWLRWRI